MSSPEAQHVAVGIQLTATANGGDPAIGQVGTQSPHVVINMPADSTVLRTASLHLLEENNDEARDKYLNLGVPLHKAALRGDWKTAQSILAKDHTLLTAAITKGWETALHIAAGAKHIHFVKELIKMMNPQDLALQDFKGNTALSFAAASGRVEIAEIMRREYNSLPTIRGGAEMTPLYMAALLGQSDMTKYLYRYTYEILNETDRNALFFTCIDTGLYDLAMKMLGSYPTLATARNESNETALHVLARRPKEFVTQSSGLWNRLKSSYKIESNETKALQLVKLLWREMLKHNDSTVMNLIRHPSELLFEATRLGNFEFLDALMSLYPDLFWELNDKNQSIIHVAVLHRHASIFNLVHEIGSIKDLITSISDDDDNNILHLAAKLAPPNQLNLVSGAALQMQRELVWFEFLMLQEVEKIVPTLSLEKKNIDGKTPRELFTYEHEELLHKGELWMKNTANSCMLVATIIATVVFSAAFSIPGGIANNSREPNFVREQAFLIFVMADGLALFSSATSTMMFLYILTSRYAENDFLKSLPLKLMVGLAALFVSILSMMIAFSTAFYLSCHNGLRLVSDFIFIFSFVPVVLFVFLQYPLLSDMFFSTYCSSLLFQPRKQMIY